VAKDKAKANLMEGTEGKKTIKVTSTNNLYYLAGFFDGEGTILITRKTNESSRGARLYLSVSVTNTNKKVIEDFNGLFPGYLGKVLKKKDYFLQAWVWTVSAEKAEMFLLKIKKYLRQKKDEAEIALEFRYLQKKLNKKRKSKGRRDRAYTSDEIHQLRLIRERLLKMRGPAWNRRIYDK